MPQELWETVWLESSAEEPELGLQLQPQPLLVPGGQQRGVWGSAEAAPGVGGGAAEPGFAEAEALRAAVRPHSGPQAPPLPLLLGLHMQTPPPALPQPARPGCERRLPTPEQMFQYIHQEYSVTRGGDI